MCAKDDLIHKWDCPFFLWVIQYKNNSYLTQLYPVLGNYIYRNASGGFHYEQTRRRQVHFRVS